MWNSIVVACISYTYYARVPCESEYVFLIAQCVFLLILLCSFFSGYSAAECVCQNELVRWVGTNKLFYMSIWDCQQAIYSFACDRVRDLKTKPNNNGHDLHAHTHTHTNDKSDYIRFFPSSLSLAFFHSLILSLFRSKRVFLLLFVLVKWINRMECIFQSTHELKIQNHAHSCNAIRWSSEVYWILFHLWSFLRSLLLPILNVFVSISRYFICCYH